MAAHVDQTTTAYASLTLTATGTARGIDGPAGAQRLHVYVETAAAVVYTQVGAAITDGTTNISTGATKGGIIPTETWVEIACTPREAPGHTSSPLRPTVFLQTDTNPTVIQYRFLLSEG